MLIEPVAFVAAASAAATAATLVTWAIHLCDLDTVQVVQLMQMPMSNADTDADSSGIPSEHAWFSARNSKHGIRNTMRSRRATFQTERHIGSESPAEPRNESTAEWPKKADGWRRRRRRSPVAEAPVAEAVAEAPQTSM